MTTVVSMPHLGVSITEATMVAWQKNEGDVVTEGELLCEVATDKAEVEVPAPASGVLARILVAAGTTVAVGAPIAEIGVELDASGSNAEDPQPAVDAPSAEPQPPEPGDGVATRPTSNRPRRVDYAELAATSVPEQPRGAFVASPAARRAAAELGVDLATVRGTGMRSRIRADDVLASSGPPLEPPLPEIAYAATPKAAPESATVPRGYEDVPHDVVPTSRLRRIIAEHMVRSRHIAAHMTTEVEVDMHAITQLRLQVNERVTNDGRPRLSVLAFIARATCIALREFPNLNATFELERLIRWQEINLGIAVDTDDGLVVPVVRQAEHFNALGLAERITKLADLARSRKLVPDDLRAGTFTISNPGSIGATAAPAIIHQPQVAILGIPAIVRRPAVVAGPSGEDTIAVRPVMALAVTFDHRALDGAEATRFAVHIKNQLETAAPHVFV